MWKRSLDFVMAALGLVLLSPLLLIVAAAVRLTSPGPALFRQRRVGRHGRDFTLLKFRTMTVKPLTESGQFEPGDVSRVTAVGRFLRGTKLDELPQLWNVLRGEMSLVGPRPEVRPWVERFPDRWRVILQVRPGITDPAAILYRDEESILRASTNPEQLYEEQILPSKLAIYESYVKDRTLLGDVKILLSTFLALVFRPRVPRDTPSPTQR